MDSNQKTLLNPVDIRTMRKDIKQIKKSGSLYSSKKELKAVKTERPKEGTEKPEVKEEQVIERILGEAAKKRHISEQIIQNSTKVMDAQQPKPEVPATPALKKEAIQSPIIEKRGMQVNTQSVQSQAKEPSWQPTETKQGADKYKEPLDQPIDVQSIEKKQKTDEEKSANPMSKAEKDKRMKFMKEIEEWASKN